MANWVRLWEDMPTDPKWRVVAKRAGRPISEVMAIFMFMMTNAGANATERGVLSNWSDEDVAAALDMEPGHVEAIRQAMQGKTLEGDKLSGWEKRQPKREDGAAERAKEWRERNRTQPNAVKRPEADAEADAEKIPPPSGGGTPPPPETISEGEIERRLEQATGWRGLRNVSAISTAVQSGADFEGRILPLARTVAAEFREQGRDTPKVWNYLLAPVNDPNRDASPCAREVATVFVPEGSPHWAAIIKSGKKESLLRQMLKKAGDGTEGIYWPQDKLPALAH